MSSNISEVCYYHHPFINAIEALTYKCISFRNLKTLFMSTQNANNKLSLLNLFKNEIYGRLNGITWILVGFHKVIPI